MALQKITCKLDSSQTSFVSFRCYFGTVLFTAAANHEAFFLQQVSESQLPVLASPICQSFTCNLSVDAQERRAGIVTLVTKLGTVEHHAST